MNLEIEKWKEFQINRLFDVEYGNSLELDSCEETTIDDPHKVNFVARTRENNGVTAYVKKIEGIKPFPSGLITVAGSGSSTLSAFVQEDVFYSGYHLFVLKPKCDYSHECKQFICICIELDKYKYWYGRQANKTLPYIKLKLPIQYNGTNPVIDEKCVFSDEGYVPAWEWMDAYIKSLHCKPLTTRNKPGQASDLKLNNWAEFTLRALFGEPVRGTRITQADRVEGEIPFVTAGEQNEGVSAFISNSEATTYENSITIDMFGNAFYHGYAFKCDDNILVMSNEYMNAAIGNFIASVLSADIYRNSYGRQYRQKDYNRHIIKLPVCCNSDGTPFIDETYRFSEEGYVPDWSFMEEYIKSLPYGDKL